MFIMHPSHTSASFMETSPNDLVDLVRMLRTPRGASAKSQRRTILSNMDSERLRARYGSERQTLFHVCILYADVDWLSALLEDGRLEPNERNRWFATPLYLAAQRGHSLAVATLVASDRVDVMRRHTNHNTALHVAVGSDRSDVVQRLLACERVDVNAQNINEKTALHRAVSLGRWNMVVTLASSPRVDLNVQDFTGATALHILAGQSKNADRLPLLLDTAEIDVNKKDMYGRTALMTACKHGSHQAVMYLVSDRRVNTKCVDNKGRTAIHLLCESSLDHGTRKDISSFVHDVVRSHDGINPVQTAIKNDACARLASLYCNGDINMWDPLAFHPALVQALASCTDRLLFRDRIMRAVAQYLTDEEVVHYSGTFPSVCQELDRRLTNGSFGGRPSNRSRVRLISCLVLASTNGHGFAKLRHVDMVVPGAISPSA